VARPLMRSRPRVLGRMRVARWRARTSRASGSPSGPDLPARSAPTSSGRSTRGRRAGAGRSPSLPGGVGPRGQDRGAVSRL